MATTRSGFVRRWVSLATLPLLAAACGAEPDVAETPAARETPAVLVADVERSPTSPAGAATAVAAVNGFAEDFIGAVAVPGENLVFSPASIALAFAQAQAGARAVTADEIATAFGFPTDPDALHGGFNALDAALQTGEAPAVTPTPTETEPFGTFEPQPPVVAIANALWGQTGMPIEAPFLETLARSYGAGVRTVDFAGDSEAAREQINGWVADRTGGLIPELFAMLRPNTRLVIANALYLSADWQRPFGKYPTSDEVFTRWDGSEVTVPTMHDLEASLYAAGEGWQAVTLPYFDTLVMDVIVPERGTAPAELVTGEVLTQVATTATLEGVDFAMPRWDFATSLDLIDVLRGLGVEAAFGDADFSGITGDRSLFIGQAVHQADIAVDEYGTVAAAATGIGFEESGPGEPAAVVHADHPFAFVIRHLETGAIVFAGQVADPAATSTSD